MISELMFEEISYLDSNNITNTTKINKIKSGNSCNSCEDFNYKYSNDNVYYKAEIALWKSVILQAMVDLQSNSKKKIANTYRIKSLMWFNLKNEEFLTVCNYAGLNPKYVYEKAMKVKEKNSFFKWIERC